MDVNLELMAMRWLWLEKDCHYVLEQRSPRYFSGVPDVIGITKSRYLIEVEVKRSVSDFRADSKKVCRRIRDMHLPRVPKFFYYMMPRKVADKVVNEIPDWAGLMCESENEVTAMVLKAAPANNQSKRLSIEECVRAVRLMVNHMMTSKLNFDTHHAKWKHRDALTFVDWVKADSGSYQI